MSLPSQPHLHHPNRKMGKPTSTNRDWSQIYQIYGMEQWHILLFLIFHAILFSVLSVLFLLYFYPICDFLDNFFLFSATSDGGGKGVARFAGCLWLSGLAGSVAYNWSQPHMKTSVRIIHARLRNWVHFFILHKIKFFFSVSESVAARIVS